MSTKVVIGTTKGLVIFHQEGINWIFDSVRFEGLPVSMLYIDPRSRTWWTSLSHRHWGEKLHRSYDEGKTWQEVPVPEYKGQFYRHGKPATLKRIWTMEHAGLDRPNDLWLGTEPGGLFYSTDGGNHFDLVESLWHHPSRQDPNQWFGAGKDFPFIHSIATDPHNSNHVYIGVSCAGIFETKDAGSTWNPINQGLVATYLPQPHPEVGHDPHRLLIHSIHTEVLWQQNHCGVFRTIDGGQHWLDVSGTGGFPKYGFALAIDDQDPLQAWVIPAHSDDQRIPVNLELTICHTRDGGTTWSTIPIVPGSISFDLVLRHSFAKCGALLACGTTNGNVYVSADSGKSWKTVSHHLASVTCLVVTD